MYENSEVLYYIDGKYYTLRRQVQSGRQYYCTLIEVVEPEIPDEEPNNG